MGINVQVVIMKKSRSKYFEYINDRLVESSVLSGAGVQALVPPDWEDKKVKVITSLSEDDYFITRAKRGKSRGYVSLPAYMAGMKVRIEFIDLEDDEMVILNLFKWLFRE
jgi:hypothetical protein